MTEAEAAVSENSNVLLQAMGTAAEVSPEISQAIPLAAGDVLILCSDGLHGLVADREIADIAARHAPEEACQNLIGAALRAGGHDNVSVGVFRVSAAGPAASRQGSATRPVATQAATREISGAATRQFSALERPL